MCAVIQAKSIIALFWYTWTWIITNCVYTLLIYVPFEPSSSISQHTRLLKVTYVTIETVQLHVQCGPPPVYSVGEDTQWMLITC